MPWQNNGGDNRNNNPWGNNGPSGGGRQTPPDLDDVIRKGQEKLKSVLPGGGGSKGSILLLVLLILAGWAASGFYRVEPSEVGVVTRFGEYVNKTTPGLNWHLPYPIESAVTPNVENVNRIDIGFSQVISRRNGDVTRRNNDLESLMLTGDENIIDIDFTVFWRILEPEKFLFNIQYPQEATIKAVAESAMREVVGQTTLQLALTSGRGTLEERTKEILQDVLNSYNAGILITEVKLEKSDPPEKVIEAFRDVQAAAADRERFQNQAETYANQVIPEARGEAQKIVQAAQAYRDQVVAKATGEASRFDQVYEQYVQAKDVTRKRIYLETMENILSGMNKMILDSKTGNGVVPYLPLNELNKKGGNNE